MDLKNAPFNIGLLTLKEEDLKNLQPVKSLDIFVSSTNNFHPEGLFSTEIFGKVGTEHRNRLFAYIDTKTTFFHPVVFKALTDLREFYGEIMSEKKYAKWDKSVKDFIPATPLDGETGLDFFIRHWEDINFEDRPSVRRQFNIRMLKKYKSQALMRYILVLPAGLRDYEISPQGKPEEGEVNTLYRKVLAMSNLISPDLYKLDPVSVNTARYNIQVVVREIYDYFRGLVEGKSKFINGKWAARKVFNSTRNVITTNNNDASYADDPTTLKANQTAVGLFQHIKAIMPLSVFQMRDSYLSKIFPGPNSPAVLVNPKTLKSENVQISSKHYDDWMSVEGINNIFNKFGERDLRHEVVMLDKHYLGLIYRSSDGRSFKFMQDIDELPEGLDKNDVSPITFAEFLYISVYKDADKIPGFFTRYPVAGYGGIYPSYTHLKTTDPSEVRVELNDDWTPSEHVAHSFPVRGKSFFDTLSPSVVHIAKLVADFDGDVCSWTPVISDEARAEIAKKLNSVDYYVDASGKMYFSGKTDIVSTTLTYLTR